jgi:hypothetical protein
VAFAVESRLKFLACTGEDLATVGSIELTKFTTDVEVMRGVEMNIRLVREVFEQICVKTVE